MNVRLTFGLKAGEVVDLPVLSARAMLADGRAVPVDAVPVAVSTVDRVASREDRGMPRSKRRAVR